MCFSLFRTELRNSTDDFDDLARLQRIGLDVRLQPRRHELDPTSTDGRLQRVTEMQRDAVRLHDGSAETRASVRPALRAALDADGEAGALAAACDDIGALARHCRFRDCRHQGEPGCAVRDAVGSERLRNFHKLRRESAPGGAERRRPPRVGRVARRGRIYSRANATA